MPFALPAPVLIEDLATVCDRQVSRAPVVALASISTGTPDPPVRQQDRKPATRIPALTAGSSGSSTEILVSSYAERIDGRQARDRIAEALGRIDDEPPPASATP